MDSYWNKIYKKNKKDNQDKILHNALVQGNARKNNTGDNEENVFRIRALQESSIPSKEKSCYKI